MKVIIIAHNQSLLDVAVQYCGSAEAAFFIALENSLSLTSDLQAGQKLTIPQTTPCDNRDIATYYGNNGIMPSTAVAKDFIETLANPGIGEMIIESTFIVR